MKWSQLLSRDQGQAGPRGALRGKGRGFKNHLKNVPPLFAHRVKAQSAVVVIERREKPIHFSGVPKFLSAHDGGRILGEMKYPV